MVEVEVEVEDVDEDEDDVDELLVVGVDDVELPGGRLVDDVGGSCAAANADPKSAIESTEDASTVRAVLRDEPIRSPDRLSGRPTPIAPASGTYEQYVAWSRKHYARFSRWTSLCI